MEKTYEVKFHIHCECKEERAAEKITKVIKKAVKTLKLKDVEVYPPFESPEV